MSNELEFNIVDCHNHSLPFIDDGAIDLEMALDMLKIASQNGTSDIALTPHHLNGAFSNFAKETRENVNTLRLHAKQAGIEINLHLGSEVHLVTETATQLVENKALTYGGLGKAALIELPKSSIPTGVESILSELIFNGITPVIAHPERNSILRKDFSQLKEWIEFGCKAQLTGQSCCGDFGANLQDTSFEMIRNSLIHLVASDAHRPEGRSPNLLPTAKVLSKVFGTDISKLLLHDNPLKLLRGKNLKSIPPQLNTSKSRIQSTRKKKHDKRSLLRRLIDFQ